MVLQIFTDAGQGVDQRNIKLAQESGLPTPERCRICGEAMAPAQSSTSLLAIAFDGALLSPSSHSTPTARLPSKIM